MAQIKYSIDEGLGLTADTLNKNARRKAEDKEVRGPMGPYDELVPFDGKLERPTLTLHGTGDLFVPIFLEQSLKNAVVSAGKESLLTQRVYRIAGQAYISISAGKLDGTDVFAVSLAAPVAVALKGLRAGEEAAFNGKMVRVLAIE